MLIRKLDLRLPLTSDSLKPQNIAKDTNITTPFTYLYHACESKQLHEHHYTSLYM